jgi:hypothetical protein
MTIHFLPDQYTRVIQTTLVVPVTAPDGATLTDPSNGWVVVPKHLEITLTREEGVPTGTRERSYVAVIGPRRLKSGALGKEIRIPGWNESRNEGLRGYCLRPGWLTTNLAENLPDGWSPELLDLEPR